jgi:hypothetical protein
MSTATSVADVQMPPPCGRGRPSSEWLDSLEAFGDQLMAVQEDIGFKMSARGWAYALENAGVITKSNLDEAKRRVNQARDKGYIPLDFTAQDDGRKFAYTPKPPTPTDDFIKWGLEDILSGKGLHRSFWQTQDVFIQILVEKVDLREVFAPVCREYSIPIATSKGWSSKNQRGEILRRAAEWRMGEGIAPNDANKKPILLYCGDFDPAGRQISGKLRKNLTDLKDAKIKVGDTYYTDVTPDNLGMEIDRFGLNKQFIDDNNLTWIDNLQTGSDNNLPLDNPAHKDHDKDYVQNWLDEIGVRKVEANALVTDPEAGRSLLRDTIERYLTDNAKQRYEEIQYKSKKELKSKLSQLGIKSELEDVVRGLKRKGGDQ